jgi:hypothetical protein
LFSVSSLKEYIPLIKIIEYPGIKKKKKKTHPFMLSFIVFAGAAIDQGVACILMLVALVLTYLIH